MPPLLDPAVVLANPSVDVHKLEAFWKEMRSLESAGLAKNRGYRLNTPLSGEPVVQQLPERFLNSADEQLIGDTPSS